MRLDVVSTGLSSAFLTSVLSLANIISTGLRSGLYGGKEKRCAPTSRIAGQLSFVASDIVEDDDFTDLLCWNRALPNPFGKRDAIHRPTEYEGCIDAVAAQTGKIGERFSPLTPTAGARHVYLDPGLVDKDATWVKPMLIDLPSHPEPGHFRPVLLACHQCFLKVFPRYAGTARPCRGAR